MRVTAQEAGYCVNTNFMNTPSTLINAQTIMSLKITLISLALVISIQAPGQQSNLTCNVPTPWVPPAFTVSESHQTTGLACWEGNVLCPGDDIPANVVNANLSDFATGNITGIGSLMLRVTDATNNYSSGNFAGFRISSSLLNLGLFGSITISTFLDNNPVESVSSTNLLTIGLDLLNDQYDIGFITSMTFDAIEITIDQTIGIGSYNVYYAIMEDFCPGPDLMCNVQTPLDLPSFPVTIDYLNTGTSGITIGEVLDPENAISADASDYASLINFADIVGSTFITVEEQITDYPSGTFVGFDIQNFTVVGAGILDNITITSYLNDVVQETVTGPDLLISGAVLAGSGRQTVGFVTSTAVDKVKFSINQPVGLNLGTTRVYHAIFQEFCAGPPLECNEITPIYTPLYPVFIDGAHTGFTGAACVSCNVVNAGNVIDNNLSNWADIIVAAGVSSTGSIAVKDQLADYPAGSFAGFHIENPSLVNANILSGITISTYLNGVLQESHTNLGALITIGSGLLVGTGEQYVGFITTLSFDEIKISLNNIIGTFDIGTTRVYGAIVERFCETLIECDTTYYLNNPEFPVYIDAFLTGVDGIACVACEVEDEQNVITADTSDYATITVIANVIGSASIAVADALYTYPSGTFAGFVIEDLGFLLEAELFESLTISTYLDGEFQESRTGNDLIDLAVIILFISADEGRYNVGFETTMPFDEIRITAGSIVTAINLIRVYSAFVDTRASNGGSLACVNGPIANDDLAVTGEETPVDIMVLENDTDDESPLGHPVLEDSPSHGEAVVNADSTITYTPDDNFVGLDTFTYSICNDDTPAKCDTASVFITVNPVIDTIQETISEDSTLTLCADELTTFNVPANSIGICEEPSNGTAVIMQECVTYTPDEGFAGNDTMCLVTCHPAIPSLCDTTIVIITVIPFQFPPDAMNDSAITEEDVPVSIDVLNNDIDPDSPIGIPVIIGQPDNGTAEVQPDSTIIYTPGPNYIGADTLSYQICDDSEPPLCDTAFVFLTVTPVRDTITEIILIDSLFEVCVSAWVEFELPVDTMLICDPPSHGLVITIDTCLQYMPDPGYSGEDTICVVVCDINENCDTTVIIVVIELPLAVQWLDFKAEKITSGAYLQWITSGSNDHQEFEIERAEDTGIFNTIGHVTAPGMTEGVNNQTYIDAYPAEGMNYYRIKEVLPDGSINYSPVRHVWWSNDELFVKVWPNPAAENIQISIGEKTEESIRIFLMHANGKIVTKEE